MVGISRRTTSLIQRLFPPSEQKRVQELLEKDCAENLPLIHSPTPERLERIRFAALRASQGDLNRLIDFISLAQIDWRDLLVAADFAESVDAHLEWAESILAAS